MVDVGRRRMRNEYHSLFLNVFICCYFTKENWQITMLDNAFMQFRYVLASWLPLLIISFDSHLSGLMELLAKADRIG